MGTIEEKLDEILVRLKNIESRLPTPLEFRMPTKTDEEIIAGFEILGIRAVRQKDGFWIYSDMRKPESN